MKRILYFILLFSNFTFSQIVSKPNHDPPVVINAYTEVLVFNICTNQFTVSDATAYNPGDTVLIIQMKGAVIDTSNTPAFGTILNYGNAGNYEFNFISAKSGNVLTLLNKLTRSYDIPDGVVQLVRIPKYKNGYFSGGLIPLNWDGTKGGVIAVISTLGLTSVENIDVTGRGFRGAVGYNAAASSSSCNQNNYYYPFTSQFANLRGESIGSVSQNLIKGKGSIAGGGGGGNSHNTGGGGGGNGGAGGKGGYQSDSCNSSIVDNGGRGGKSLDYNPAINKIFMGSGGGAGHVDNASGLVPEGGNGGGIIIIITEGLDMVGEHIVANGDAGRICGATNCNDGSTGGGAGGTVLLSISSALSNFNVEVKGGKGADVYGSILPGGRAGPGGGGGAGVLFNSGSALPANITFIKDGGLSGVIQQDANNPWGATAGSDGVNLFNLVLPWDNVLFKPNIDSVKFTDSVNYCNNIQFKGLGFTNTFPVASWQWFFGDGGTANTQNPIHNYNAVGNYNVKLIVTDVNGCKDSTSTTINTNGNMLAQAGVDSTLCASGPVSIKLNGNGTGTYSWSPPALLNNNTLQNPVATIDTTTTFYLTVSNGTGCSVTDAVTITVNKNPVVKTLRDSAICKNATLILTTTGAVNYNWSPGIYVSDSTIANPQYTDTASHTLIVTGTGLNGCKASDTIKIDVKAPVIFLAPPNKSFCKGNSVLLNGNNANAFQYLWSPAFYLSNANIKNPVANPPVTTAYTVNITDNTCNTDSIFIVNVTVLPLPFINATKSNDINCNKPFAQLKASGATTYTWAPAYALSNSSIANPIANPAATTTYFVTAANNNGCTNRDSIVLLVNFAPGGILLPNSFTPNGDGNNDCFGIGYYRDVQDLEFIIYNRYGNIVFKTQNAAECWNGRYKGQPADSGSYVYFIKAKTLCGNVVKKGTLLLLH